MIFERYKMESDSDLQRLKVPGGWLIKMDGYREIAICFYPDPLHLWIIDEPDTNRCLTCGGHNFDLKTNLFKAFCHIQYLVDDSLFCVDCQSDEIRERLKNPIKSCDECDGTDSCPNSRAAFNAIRKNCSQSQRQGPEDLRDDWPHAIPVPGGARLSLRR